MFLVLHHAGDPGSERRDGVGRAAHGNPVKHYGDLDLTLKKNSVPQTGSITQLL